MRNITGQRFGRLVAVEPTNIRHDSKIVWMCTCDCGNEAFVVSRSLITGNTKSCGCLNRERLQKGLTKLDAGISAFNQLYSNYVRHAKLRGLLFNLSRDEFFNITQQNCHYCGKPPLQIQQGKHLNGKYIYNGVDRVDNSKGYFLENCVPCCGICNRAKDVMSKDEFLSWIEEVYNNQKCFKF